jgi:hypothetical protein
MTAALDRFPEVNTVAYRDGIREKLMRACPVASKILVLARKQAAKKTEDTQAKGAA